MAGKKFESIKTNQGGIVDSINNEKKSWFKSYREVWEGDVGCVSFDFQPGRYSLIEAIGKITQLMTPIIQPLSKGEVRKLKGELGKNG